MGPQSDQRQRFVDRIISQGRAQFSSIYFDPAISLETRLEAAFKKHDVHEPDQSKIRAHLSNLKAHHEPTYEHSIRVALVVASIAEFLGIDSRSLLTAGLLHDIGKCKVPIEVLSKTTTWNAADQEIIKKHVLDGYEMVKEEFPYSAFIMVWHHRFQKNPYPDQIPIADKFSEATRALIPTLGRFLALADTYDALHRKNVRHRNGTGLTGQEIKEVLFRENEDLKKLVEALYDRGILSTQIFNMPSS